jgi:hypothetical protein
LRPSDATSSAQVLILLELVAERDLRERQPELAWRGFDAVRARLS